MKKTLVILAIFVAILYSEIQDTNNKDSIVSEYDFITASEYGKYLYENPRGISCKSCHGDFGEGEVIAKYMKNDKEIEIKAPNILTLSKEKFELAFTHTKGIMPKYYLTKQEIDAIFSYITSHNLQNVK